MLSAKALFIDMYLKSCWYELHCILSYPTQSLVGGHGAADPGVVVAHLGVNTGLVLHGTAVSPGHHTLQHTVAHHGATRVTLRQRERRRERRRERERERERGGRERMVTLFLHTI